MDLVATRGTMDDLCEVDVAAHRKENTMGKRGRKKRARKKNAANHGKRPNA
ncbi:hypothetical protein GCM10007298_21660 [Williamsia phyllosphaerae]|uniref:Uncharacterized protein n=3 Tax=Mycobacteriales TaxID=85007 RepID=A0ABQ1US30_9NOCA|nr:hypothetical protein GCM10007298_21660 [Williamsia phyllosphaerae]